MLEPCAVSCVSNSGPIVEAVPVALRTWKTFTGFTPPAPLQGRVMRNVKGITGSGGIVPDRIEKRTAYEDTPKRRGGFVNSAPQPPNGVQPKPGVKTPLHERGSSTYQLGIATTSPVHRTRRLVPSSRAGTTRPRARRARRQSAATEEQRHPQDPGCQPLGVVAVPP